MHVSAPSGFSIERWVARGGMGDVYLAVHRETGRRAAIKKLTVNAHANVERFELEARALRSLRHDAIVEFMADGRGDDGVPWIAMEWLEGRDLAERLREAPLTVDESITLVRRIAEALAHAHGCGLIHRDLKPSNVFLPDGDLSRAKVLDFGLARYVDRTHALTSTHHVIGTVAYMAPEQARAERTLDARTDVYSLGVLWFETLTGALPFAGEHAFAVLAKLLLEDPPRVRSYRRDVSLVLEDLVAQMIARDPARRPPDGRAVIRALDAVRGQGAGAIAAQESSSSGRAAISHREARFGSVILVAPVVSQASDDTIDVNWSASSRRSVESIARGYDGEAIVLSGDALIVTLAAGAAPADSAERAAACAAAIAREHSQSCISLAVGTIERSQLTPAGVVIDRVVSIARDIARSGVWTDESTARLVARRFSLEPHGLYFQITGLAHVDADDRTLLGKRTPFVGRDRELAILEGIVHESLDEDVARSVLITAPPGAGKSRLRAEFVARVNVEAPLHVLTAAGDPLSPGAALSLARQLLRSAARLRDGAPLDELSRSLRDHLDSLGLSLDEPTYATLAELAMITPAASRSGDPDTSRHRFAAALSAWLDALVARGPTIMVLEDLHWGDVATVDYLIHALRRRADRPFVVIAFARPEVRTWLPDGRLTETTVDLPLGGLTRRACERLVRAMLGDELSASRVGRLVVRADGNAFHLEELIRRSVEWGDDDLPETVFALLQSRLDAIGPEPRRALRAGSVFGERFWSGGVRQMLGYADDASTCELLDQLVQQEVLEAVRESRFAGQREYSFRHALLREAAYATLTDADREAAHRLAGEWLVEIGEQRPDVLATHFDKGGDHERALPWIVAAADVAFFAYQLDDAIELAERGIRYGATGPTLGRLHATAADVLTWKSEPERARRHALEGLRNAERAGPHWFLCASLLVLGALNQGDADEGVMEVLQTVLSLEKPPPPSGRCAFSLAMLQYGMLLAGQRDLMAALIEPLRAASRSSATPDVEFMSWHLLTEAFVALYCVHRAGDAIVLARRGEAMSLTSKAIAGVEGRAHLATTLLESGQFAEAERTIHGWIASAEERGLSWMVGLANGPLARALLGQGRIPEALSTAQHGIADPVPTNALLARIALAEVLFAAGRFDDAEAAAEIVVACGIDALVLQANLVLAHLASLRGDHTRALAQCDAAFELLERAATAPLPYYGLEWARIGALRALERHDEATMHLARTRAILRDELDSFHDEPSRAAFLALAPIAALDAAR